MTAINKAFAICTRKRERSIVETGRPLGEQKGA